MIQYHKAYIHEGKFISDRKLFLKRIATMPDGDYLLCLIKQSNRTTRDFQNHYFAILGDWALDQGWEKADLHEYVKEHLFPELFGEEVSTANLSIEQWNIVFLNLENFLILKFENQ